MSTGEEGERIEREREREREERSGLELICQRLQPNDRVSTLGGGDGGGDDDDSFVFARRTKGKKGNFAHSLPFFPSTANKWLLGRET